MKRTLELNSPTIDDSTTGLSGGVRVVVTMGHDETVVLASIKGYVVSGRSNQSLRQWTVLQP